jgi:hypothetical protein
LRYLHTIGNLTLTGYNPELSNKPFAEKKIEFAKSHVELNKHFASFDDWNEEAIKQRADILFEVAIQVWRAP